MILSPPTQGYNKTQRTLRTIPTENSRTPSQPQKNSLSVHISPYTPPIHLLAGRIFPRDARHPPFLFHTPHFPGLESTLPQFHMHPSDAYEIATLFLFSSFLYRRINSAPFSMRHRNTTHPPPTTRGQKKALALYFMYQIRKKKWSFSTPPPFLWPLIQRPQNRPKKKLSTGFPDENTYRLGNRHPDFRSDAGKTLLICRISCGYSLAVCGD